LPINEAGRLKADSWDASILTLREHQAKPHPSTYSLRGPANIRIRRQLDPVTEQTIGYELFGTFGQATRMLWTDGRPHPPDHAAHTWAGFSTARWDGNALTVFTTHLKAGWLQRNGVAHSDQATMTERFFRHGNHLMVVTIVDDPIYLEEPFIRTTNWVLNPDQEVRRTQFDVVDEVAERRRGDEDANGDGVERCEGTDGPSNRTGPTQRASGPSQPARPGQGAHDCRRRRQRDCPSRRRRRAGDRHWARGTRQ
jgi:hypothetical protein